ncbi:MAG: acylphosphatase [Nanoarchaeota archaeon]|nr:acylphosphatase [Nanoarchaeota archaeon]MCG2718784.1 acylphosphatase [Nanoarchaeota archaeon]
MKRIHVFIAGMVQGVFFRAHTRDKANELNLKGWVKNLSDGRVEVVAEGEDSAIKELIKFLKSGPFGANVDHLDIEEEKYIGEFEFFEIKS